MNDSSLFKEIEKVKNKIGWIVIGEMKSFTYSPITLESIPDAWCGVKFKIEVIAFGSENIILGSPELLDYPIDFEELKKILIEEVLKVDINDLRRIIEDSVYKYNSFPNYDIKCNSSQISKM